MKFNREIGLRDIISIAMVGLMSYMTLHFVTRKEYEDYQKNMSQVLSIMGKSADSQHESIVLLQEQTKKLSDHEDRLRVVEGRNRGFGSVGPKEQMPERQIIQ